VKEIYYIYSANILSKMYHLVYPFSFFGNIVGFRDVDTGLRLNDAAKQLEATDGKFLDVGAGGLSPFTFLGCNVLSFDIRRQAGINLVGSVTHLPFRDDSFDVVFSLDTIEHVPRAQRVSALKEMIRVAKEKVIIHTPLENGVNFLGRQHDLAFNEWFEGHTGVPNIISSEHISNIEPSPAELQDLGFSINGTRNAKLWFKFMRFQYLPNFKLKYSLNPLHVVEMVGWLFFTWIFYFFHRHEDKKPPFWGGICTLHKRVEFGF